MMPEWENIQVYQMRKSIVDPDGSLSAIASVDTVANTTQKRMRRSIVSMTHGRPSHCAAQSIR
jgi:hypothetical protein